MEIKTKLENDLKDAMRAGDDLKKRTLRMVLSAIKLAEVDKGSSLDESVIISILQKEVKSRHETIDEAKRANRPELANAAYDEISVLEAYLPQQLSDEDLEELVRQVIQETGVTTPAGMGNVMKSVMPQVQGRADGARVSQIVRLLLQQS